MMSSESVKTSPFTLTFKPKRICASHTNALLASARQRSLHRSTVGAEVPCVQGVISRHLRSS